MHNQHDKTPIADVVSMRAMLEQFDGVPMRGDIHLRFIDEATGKVVEERDLTNIITTVGKTHAAQRMVGTASAVASHLAMGSGATAVAVGDTVLTTETARVALTSYLNAANVVTAIGTIPAGTGTGTVNEIGLLNAASVGTLIAHALTGAITKAAGMAIEFTWSITMG